ncbi:MAG: Cna B-type domain-containing protein, partial [Oscillospiraceae bacterium]|nr:Cna B-type domain-containing protein [Oscillospiraceae bacterium]
RRFYVIPFMFPDPSTVSVTKTQPKYTKATKTDTSDHILNDLQRGNTVLIPYKLSIDADIQRMTYWNGEHSWDEDGIGDYRENIFDRTKYGQREIKVELEDYNVSVKDMVNGGSEQQTLGIGDYDIAKVTLTQPTIYVWTQPTVDENGERIVDIYSPWYFAVDEEASASTPLTLYGRSLDENGEWGEWIAYAVLQNGEVTVSEGAETNTREVTKKNASGVWEFVRYEYDVTLPAGVHQVKTSVVSKKSRVQMGYEVSVRLYPDGPIVKDTVERAVAADSEETYAWVSLVNDSRGYATIDTSQNANYDGNEEIPESGNDSNKTGDSSAVGQLHGRSFKNAVSLDKSYEYYEPEEGSNESTPYKLDAENGRMEFTNKVVLTLQSNVPYDLKDEYDKLINEGTLPNTQSGTFYELLPEGVSLDETSIKIDGGSGVIEDVYTIENYMFSGRTLVVVKATFTKSNTEYISNSYHYANGRQTTLDAISKANREKDSINYPASGWMSRHTLTYVSYLPYDEAFSRAVNGMIPPLVNAVVYEADEEALATIAGWRGEPDDPSAGNNVRSLEEIAPENGLFDLTELTTNLDGARDDPSFVYATAYLDITQGLFGVLLQGQKHVSKDGMSWESGTTIDARVTVYEGTTYVYRINKVVTKGDKQCNIIFYDPLEIAEADEHGAWQGTFESVDVSALRELGIVPVVYYYTGTAALPTEFASLANDLNYKTGAGWSTELPSDPSTVKAIVVDASKDANGNAVVIEASEEEDSYVPIYIHMRAPLGEEPFANSEDRMDAEKNAHAFNKAFTYCESAGEGKEGAVYGWFHTSSTMVGILPYSVSVTKAWNDHDDNDGIRPESITVSLYGNGVLVSTKTVTPDEDGNWYVEFPHVRRFDDKSVPITYTVVETNIDGYEASVELTSSTEAMQSFKITNSHDDELTSIPFTKIWDIPDGEDDGEDRPTALVMHLYRWVETTTVDAETGEETTTGEWVDTGAMKYLRAGDNDAVWSGSFDNLKKYENHGKEIIYTVREEAIERYITSYDEYTPGDADEDNKNAPEITNRYYPYSDIVITKTVVNATAKALEGENGVFTFNLALTYKGEAVVQYFDYEKTLADGTVETGKILGVSEFTLRDGESLKILKVRADTEYEITENDKAGYTLISASGTTGTVKAGVTSEAKFTNHYESSGYATLEARKELTGRALAGYQFRFELKNADGEVIGTAYNSASSDSTVEGGTATVYLPNLNYTEADDGAVYYYTVSETVPDPLPGGYTYDNTVYTVKVSVADNGNGTLTIEVEYVDLPEGGTEPVFKNEYHAEGALGLKAWKALKGGSLADYEDVFEFEIVDENGERVGETATNDAEGVILFDEIEYTEKDVGKTYLYVIREINTEDERVIYDEDVFG